MLKWYLSSPLEALGPAPLPIPDLSTSSGHDRLDRLSKASLAEIGRKDGRTTKGACPKGIWTKATASTLGFLIHGFWAGRKSLIFGVWAAPAAPEPNPKGGGLRPPHLLEWFFGPPGPPKTSKSTISGRPKNHVLETQL